MCKNSMNVAILILFAGSELWASPRNLSQSFENDEPHADQLENERREKESEASFQNIMMQNVQVEVGAMPAGRGRRLTAPPGGMRGGAIPATPSTVEVGLERYERVRGRVASISKEQSQHHGPPVVLGAADYRGHAVDGVLQLKVRFDVTLAGEGRWKLVPLIGDSVVIVGASRDGRALSLSRQNGYHVWVTQFTGEASLELDVRVPSRGRRGSIEYDFKISKTPITTFACEFPESGLEPRLFAAVRADTSTRGAGTLLQATLRPTTRINMVGFRDVGDESSRQAKIYAESLSLLSVDEDALELFTVLRYNILYAGSKNFDVLIPKGMTLVSAEGEGAFRYTEEKRPDGVLLKGETAFPIRNSYEISLRLRREIQHGGEVFDVVRPIAVAVERDSGWLGVEVTGKLKLEEHRVEHAAALDMRQLPPEMLKSAVNPILRAYRYHDTKARISLRSTRLPEKEPNAASVDSVRALTTVSPEGDILTEMRITLRNRLRHHLSLGLPAGMTVRSALLDGAPVKPSRNESGQLMLPLKRSTTNDAFTVQVTLQSEAHDMGMFGTGHLKLPTIDLPVSSVSWSVFLPARNTYSRIDGDIERQSLWGYAHWHQPTRRAQRSGGDAGPRANGGLLEMAADHGAMPVRIQVPRSGRRVEYQRYWLNAGQRAQLSFMFVRSWVLGPIALLALLLALLGGALAADRALGSPALPPGLHRMPMPALILMTLCALGGLGFLWGGKWVAVAALVAAAAATAARYDRFQALAVAWWQSLREDLAARSSDDAKPGFKASFWVWAWRLCMAGAIVVLGLVLLVLVPQLGLLLLRPLGG